MKIGKKLLISNILTSLAAMIALSIVISILVSNYIKGEISDSIIEENTRVSEYFTYKKFLEIKDDSLVLDKDFLYFARKTSARTITFIYDGEEYKSLIEFIGSDKKGIQAFELSEITEQDLMKTYDIEIKGRMNLGYNNMVNITFSDRELSILVVTFIPNYQITEAINSIIIVLIAVIILISLTTGIIAGYTGRRITRPIEIIKRITEKIANKSYNEKVVINTGGELKELADSINNMADKIKKHDSERKKFYENISHELKTPLTVISGYAEGVRNGIFDDNDRALETISKECALLKKQAENVIYLSKLDAVNDFYNFENASINEVISEAIKKLDSIIILNDIDINYNPATDRLIDMDRDKIKRMLVNILSNCLKYTKDRIEIKTGLYDKYFRIEISDNGEGFSPEILENPFSGTFVGVKDGTGIGLMIIKKIVDMHSGVIRLTNEEGGGAVYSLDIPLEKVKL